MADIDEILGEVKLPEKSVELCMRADLAAQFEDLDRQLEIAREKPGKTLAGNAEAVELAQLIQALREEMRAHMRTFRLRALPKRQWMALIDKHPPREGDLDHNPETFPIAALSACAIDPVISEEKAGMLVDRISQGQWVNLWNAVLTLNIGTADIPFSVTASAVLRGSPRS